MMDSETTDPVSYYGAVPRGFGLMHWGKRNVGVSRTIGPCSMMKYIPFKPIVPSGCFD